MIARVGRGLTLGLGLLALFVMALIVFFPTDALLRDVIARATPKGAPALVFRRALLRPWGVVLEEPALRRPDGSALLNLDWIRFRPSVHGLLRDRTGRPWHIAVGACRGTGEAIVGTDAGAVTVALAWRELDLADCPPLAVTGGALAGHAEGAANILLQNGSPPAGEGSIQLRDALWRTAAFGLDVLHADTAFLRWRLDGGRLTLGTIDLHGPELQASGTGAVDLAGSIARSAVDFRLAVLPGPQVPPPIRDFLDTLPAAPDSATGARRLTVTGTANAPQLVR